MDHEFHIKQQRLDNEVGYTIDYKEMAQLLHEEYGHCTTHKDLLCKINKYNKHQILSEAMRRDWIQALVCIFVSITFTFLFVLQVEKQPQVSLKIPPKTTLFEPFHYDVNNPLSIPTRKDRREIGQTAAPVPAPPAPQVQVVLPSRSILKRYLENGSSSDHEEYRRSKKKHLSTSPASPPGSLVSEETVAQWLEKIRTKPMANYVNMDMMRECLDKQGFLDLPLSFLQAHPRETLQSVFGFTVPMVSFICMYLDKVKH